MPIDVVDVHNTITNGLRSAWVKHFHMTDERDEDIKPEYLTTAAICYELSDFIHHNSMHGHLTVRAEEQTKSLWVKALLPLFMKIKTRVGLKSDSAIRKGNVDISLSSKGCGICEVPFGVIENKGFLSFTQSGVLYAGSMAEVKKDLERNIEFVSDSSGHGIEYSGFTFYLRDKNSVLHSEGAIYCQEKKQYFENLCKQLIPCNSIIKLEVEVNTLDSNLFFSKTEAEETDESGCPAYITDGTWNIVYGIISIYRVGSKITHNKSFNTDALKRAG